LVSQRSFTAKPSTSRYQATLVRMSATVKPGVAAVMPGGAAPAESRGPVARRGVFVAAVFFFVDAMNPSSFG
jgi:hypothetical protein